MKIFIDSASLKEIEKAFESGICDGVTTNPSLIKKAVDEAEGGMKNYIKKICQISKGPVSLEVTETSYEGMVKQGKKLFRLFNKNGNVAIKIPVNPSFEGNSMDGIKAIKKLSNARIPVNATLIFSPEQALLAAKAGAKFVSPFAGRMDDYIRSKNGIIFQKTDYFPSYGWRKAGDFLQDNGIISGVDLVKQIVEIFKKHNIKSKVLAASIRSVRQMREAALVGADIATAKLSIIEKAISHPKTIEGMKKFTEDIVPEYANLK